MPMMDSELIRNFRRIRQSGSLPRFCAQWALSNKTQEDQIGVRMIHLATTFSKLKTPSAA
jgi:hypothetical protein